jgi:hypothetical protein
MTDTATAEPGLGHNLPAGFDALRARVDELVDAANAWIKQVPEVDGREKADRLEGFIAQATAEQKAAEAARKSENEPMRLAVEAVNNRYKPLTTRLQTILDLLKPKLAKFLAAERERIRREQEEAGRVAAEAARKAEEARRQAEKNQTVENVVAVKEAEEKAAAALANRDAAADAKPQARSEYSARARTLREVRSAEIVDIDECFKFYRSHPDVRECLTKLASADARRKDGPAVIPGCRIISTPTLG